MKGFCMALFPVIEFFRFVNRVARMVHAKLSESSIVHFGKDDGAVGLAAPQLRKLLQSHSRQRVGYCGDRKGQENLIQMKPGIVPTQRLCFEFADRLKDGLWDQQNRIPDAGKML